MDMSGHLSFHEPYMSAVDTVENPASTRTALGRLARELNSIAFPCIACGINLVVDPAIGQPDPTEDTHWDHSFFPLPPVGGRAALRDQNRFRLEDGVPIP
jgi:hypothetical protein